MSVGQFVEETLMRRLSDRTKDTENPSDYEFNHIMSQLSLMIDKFAGRTSLPGLSDDDLKSLYAMKVHQVLRRGKYDRTKNPRVFFYLVFNNFNRDINRLIGVAQRQQLEEDSFEYSFSVDTMVTEIYALEPEKHKLDGLMERLEGSHRRIIDITLSNLDKGNVALVPLAKEILDFWA